MRFYSDYLSFNLNVKFLSTIFFIIILFPVKVYSSDGNSNLKERLKENGKLFQENLDEAYLEFDELLQESIRQSDSISELTILDRKCRYFYSKNRLDELIIAAEILQKKSKVYNDSYSQAMADIYLAEAYSINGIHQKSLEYLNLAYGILERDKSQNPRVFFAKANVLNSYANVYLDLGEPKKAVLKLKQVIASYNTLKNPEDIQRFQYLNYSNISNIYLLYNLDSAFYYANQSIQLKPKDTPEDKVMMMNYYVLGKINQERNNFSLALDFYRKSIQINKISGVELNAEDIYGDLVKIFGELNQPDSVIFYENKLKDLEINILQSKYNSLQKVIDKEKTNNEVNFSIQYLWFGIIFLLGIGGIFFYLRKNKKQKKYLAFPPHESFHNLLNLLEKNDPAFMFSFEKIYPDFSEKLLSINPQLSKSEIEFCALLKMNIPTKEIARYTFIEPRTVQNKKYRIRKRLNIQSEEDIYNWFDSVC